MKYNRITYLFIVVFITSLSTPSNPHFVYQGLKQKMKIYPVQERLNSYIDNEPINILSDTEFASHGFSGNGSVSNPYRIENFNITSLGNCISIQNTRVNFVIINCLLTGGASGSGISLNNISHCGIFSNIIHGKNYGLSIYSSNDILIENNTIKGSSFDGIRSSSSSSLRLYNNTIATSYGDGINCEDSDGIILEYNTIYENTDDGIDLLDTLNITINHNLIFGSTNEGLLVYSSSNLDIISNNITNNIQSGLRIFFSNNITISKNRMSKNEFYGIYLHSCFYIVSDLNEISNNRNIGYFIEESTNNIFDNNLVANNWNDGIRLSASSVNVFTSNTILNNSENGLEIYFSQKNKLENNDITNNSESGVRFHLSSKNDMKANRLSNNGIQFIGSDINQWFQNITSDNTVNQKTLGYFWNTSNVDIDGSQYGQLILANCTRLIVSGGVLANTTAGIESGFTSLCTFRDSVVIQNNNGIHLYKSEFISIFNNTIANNRNVGLLLESSSNNTILENSIVANMDDGVILQFSHNNRIINNTIISNYPSGIFIDYSSYNIIINNRIESNLQFGINCASISSRTSIYNNILAYNGIENAYDMGTENKWNNSASGNSWSDYYGGGLHIISGSAGSIDYHPRMYPVRNSTSYQQFVTSSTVTSSTDHSITNVSETHPSTSQSENGSYLGIVILFLGASIGLCFLVLIPLYYKNSIESHWKS